MTLGETIDLSMKPKLQYLKQKNQVKLYNYYKIGKAYRTVLISKIFEVKIFLASVVCKFDETKNRL